MMFNLCAPAIIYIIFSLTQVIIDSINGLYNTAFIKTIIMIIITFLLQILCQSGLNVVSWIIVFIPFIFMTVITSIVLYVFGLNAATGTINVSSNENNVPSNVSTDASGNIIVYNPYYDPFYHPVYYKSPNVIIPRPPTSEEQKKTYPSNETYIYPYPNPVQYTLPTTNVPNSISSSPAYQ